MKKYLVQKMVFDRYISNYVCRDSVYTEFETLNDAKNYASGLYLEENEAVEIIQVIEEYKRVFFVKGE